MNWNKDSSKPASLEEIESGNVCGTTACLAGWVVLVSGYSIADFGLAVDRNGKTLGHIEDVARELLEIGELESDYLFNTSDANLDFAMQMVFRPGP